MAEHKELTAMATGSSELDLVLAPTGSPTLQIMMNEKLFDRCKQISGYMAKAEGVIPRHLLGKPEACFAVLCRAFTWKLDPYAVAMSTYMTPGGSIGYEGKLCQAILENSGKLEGPVTYEHYGDDWSQIQGAFEIKKSAKSGKEYPAPTWTNETIKDLGLGVTVRAKVVGEVEPRELSFDLIQAFPRNSTLWALDPKTQICYTAVRRFANVCAPGVFLGVPFDREDLHQGFENAKDVTPDRPTRGDYVAADGSTVPEGKSLREHYVEQAQERKAADMDATAQGVMSNQMPDTAEERGDVAEAESISTDQEEQEIDDSAAKPAAKTKKAPTAKTAPADPPDPVKDAGGYADYYVAKVSEMHTAEEIENFEFFEEHQRGRLSKEEQEHCNAAADARRGELSRQRTKRK